MTGPTYEASPRRSPFRERVMALAGRGMALEPTPGGGQRGGVPSDHMVAAALSFGRLDADDVGPDIAIDLATGRPANWRKVCEWLGRELVRTHRGMPGNERRQIERWRPYAAHVAVAAYNWAVRGYHVPDEPEGADRRDWGIAVLTAERLLTLTAEDALARAARRWRAEA